jgi:hypothetical protein
MNFLIFGCRPLGGIGHSVVQYVTYTTIKMQNVPKAPIAAADIISIL